MGDLPNELRVEVAPSHATILPANLTPRPPAVVCAIDLDADTATAQKGATGAHVSPSYLALLASKRACAIDAAFSWFSRVISAFLA